MFRRRRTQTGPDGGTAPGMVSPVGVAGLAQHANDLQAVYARVLQSFIDGSGATAPPGSTGPTPAVTPPLGAGQAAPPPLNVPGAAFAGPLGASPGVQNQRFGLSAMGGANPQQMQAAEARAQAAIQEALGPANLAHMTQADVATVQSRLSAMRAEGRITDEQHAALSEGLIVLAHIRP